MLKYEAPISDDHLEHMAECSGAMGSVGLDLLALIRSIQDHRRGLGVIVQLTNFKEIYERLKDLRPQHVSGQYFKALKETIKFEEIYDHE